MSRPLNCFASALVLWSLCSGAAWAQPSAAAVQTTYVPAGAQFAGVAFPQRMLTAREMELYPLEVFSAVTLKEAGFDVLHLEQVTFSGQATEGQPFKGGAVLRFSQPIDKARAIAGLGKVEANGRELTKAMHGQHEYFKVEGGDFAAAAPTDRTLLIADEAWLKQMLDAALPPAGKPSRIVSLLSLADSKADFAAVVDMTALAGQLTKTLDKEQIPPQFEKFKRIPALINHLSGSASMRAGLLDRLTVQAKDESAAKELETLIPEGLELFRQQVLTEMAKQPKNTLVEKATVQYVERVSKELATALRPTRRGLELSLTKESGAGLTEIAVLNAMLLPAVQAARNAGGPIAVEVKQP